MKTLREEATFKFLARLQDHPCTYTYKNAIVCLFISRYHNGIFTHLSKQANPKSSTVQACNNAWGLIELNLLLCFLFI